ncbi:MAG: hypothetical protein ACI9KN_002113, partial [Gammaproteobacteria bacterium]
NSNFFVSARKHRAENRSVQGLHEESLPRETLWVSELGADAAIVGKVHF